MRWDYGVLQFVQAVDVDRPLKLGLQNVSDANGLAIAVTGMVIVFCALTLITLFIASLPKILAVLGPYLPVVQHAHHAQRTPAESLPKDQEQIVAAIGYVLHTEMQTLQD